MSEVLVYFGIAAAFLVVVWLSGLALTPIVNKREAAGKKTENPYVIAAAFWIIVGGIAIDVIVEYIL